MVAAVLALQREAWALRGGRARCSLAGDPGHDPRQRPDPARRARHPAPPSRSTKSDAKVEEPDHGTDLVPLAQWLPQLELTQIKDAHDGEIGVVADGTSWSGLLEVTSDNTLFTDRGAELDLASLGALTRQDDVVFAGIQVVTLTVPAPREPCAAPVSGLAGWHVPRAPARQLATWMPTHRLPEWRQ